MKVRSVTLDKHMPAFGAASTIKNGLLNIKEIKLHDHGVLVLKYEAHHNVDKLLLVPWASIKSIEVEEATSRPKKKND